ncbi:MAG: hypothetical protein RMJ96_01465 [Candidatus Bipolaricaulota bacterium]|nr:hypothetical protein [Candidatus Bipolaricaulota bacterium]MDW8328838.1 hypothetical protein [Candidatus Bipolaricaulota bacterium]
MMPCNKIERRRFLTGAGAIALALSAPQVQAQTVSLDLKALVLSRLDELIKLAEKPPVPSGVTFSFPTSPLKEAQKAFDAGKFDEADKQLTAFSVSLHMLRLGAPAGWPFSIALITETLRAALYKVINARVLFAERVQNKPMKISVGLYTSGTREEVFGPFLIECPKELKLSIQGKEETFKLKECQSV